MEMLSQFDEYVAGGWDGVERSQGTDLKRWPKMEIALVQLLREFKLDRNLHENLLTKERNIH